MKCECHDWSADWLIHKLYNALRSSSIFPMNRYSIWCSLHEYNMWTAKWFSGKTECEMCKPATASLTFSICTNTDLTICLPSHISDTFVTKEIDVQCVAALAITVSWFTCCITLSWCGETVVHHKIKVGGKLPLSTYVYTPTHYWNYTSFISMESLNEHGQSCWKREQEWDAVWIE